MDLDSRLASLSLGEIASLLSPKQQEVLLASISVAASLIQQIQQEDSMHQQQQINSNSNLNQTEIEDSIQLHYGNSTNSNLNNNNGIINNNNNNNNISNLSNISNLHNSTNISNLHHSRQTDFEDDSSLNNQDEDFEDQDHLTDTEDSIDEQHDLHPIPHQAHQRHRQQLQHTEMLGDETDEKDLLTIRRFAEELKQRRKSIRLSQKGAAQSLRAFTGGVQPCTDAIIYHFENLQLEPERAMQLIPLLREWLEWAEKYRFSGKQLPQMSAVTKVPRERKRKVVLFNEKAKQYLEDAFLKNNHPDRYQLEVISQELDIPTRSIRKWFTNRRQRKRFAEKFSPAS